MFNAVHLVPEIESTHVVGSGDLRIAGGLSYDSTDVSRLVENERLVEFDAMLYTAWIEGAIGIRDAIELSARLSGGYLYQNQGDEIRVFDGLTQQLEPRRRDVDFERLVLGAKIEFLHADVDRRHPGVAVAVHFKLPLARNTNLLDNGEVDVGLGVHGSMPLGRLTVFLGGGYVLIGGERIFDPSERTSDLAFYGGGINFEMVDGLHVILQIQGHTNAFPGLSPIDSNPLLFTGGLRTGWGRVVLEGYIGKGWGQGASDFVAGVSVQYVPGGTR